MSYRNKTYIIFDADEDILQYRMMTAWKENKKIDFNFHNAHELNNLRTKSSEATIKDKLRERLKGTKQAIILLGDSTKNLYKFVKWEIEVALDMQIPIIAVNLNGKTAAGPKVPPVLRDNGYYVTVPYEINKIKYALDNFPDEFKKNKNDAPSSRSYDWSKTSL